MLLYEPGSETSTVFSDLSETLSTGIKHCTLVCFLDGSLTCRKPEQQSIEGRLPRSKDTAGGVLARLDLGLILVGMPQLTAQ